MSKVWMPVADGTYYDRPRERKVTVAGDMLRIGEGKEFVLGNNVRLCRLIDLPRPEGSRPSPTPAATPAGAGVPSAVRQAIGYIASIYWLAHAGPNKTYEIVMAWLTAAGRSGDDGK